MKSYLARLAAAVAGALALAGLLGGLVNAQAPTQRAELVAQLDWAPLWVADVRAQGGTVSDTRLAALKALAGSLAAKRIWQRADDYWLLTAENSIQALTSLKQRRRALPVNSPTFTADRGYAFDGLTSYLNTTVSFASAARAASADSSRVEVYERTDVNSATYAMGANNTLGRVMRISPRTATSTMVGGGNASNSTFTLASNDSRGLSVIARDGAAVANVVAYKNGASLTRSVDSSGVGASLPPGNIFVGAQSSSGAAANLRASTVGLVSYGAALTAAQEADNYTLWQAFFTSIGANVP